MSSLFFFVLLVIGWEGMAMATPGENISCHDPVITGEGGPNYLTYCSKPLEPSPYTEGDSFEFSINWKLSPNNRSAIAMHLRNGPFKREAMCYISVQSCPLSFPLPSPPPPVYLSPSSSPSPSPSLPEEGDCLYSSTSWVPWRSPCITLPDYSHCTVELASDGNFQIRSDRGVEWSSGTQGEGATQIRVHDDGFIELLDARNATIWKSSDVPSSPKCSHSFPSFSFHGLPPLLLLLALLTFLSLP